MRAGSLFGLRRDPELLPVDDSPSRRFKPVVNRIAAARPRSKPIHGADTNTYIHAVYDNMATKKYRSGLTQQQLAHCQAQRTPLPELQELLSERVFEQRELKLHQLKGRTTTALRCRAAHDALVAARTVTPRSERGSGTRTPSSASNSCGHVPRRPSPRPASAGGKSHSPRQGTPTTPRAETVPPPSSRGRARPSSSRPPSSRPPSSRPPSSRPPSSRPRSQGPVAQQQQWECEEERGTDRVHAYNRDYRYENRAREAEKEARRGTPDERAIVREHFVAQACRMHCQGYL